MARGQRRQALLAARERAARCRAQVGASCQNTAALAAALVHLADCLRAAGEPLEALEVAQEACLAHRVLAALCKPLELQRSP